MLGRQVLTSRGSLAGGQLGKVLGQQLQEGVVMRIRVPSPADAELVGEAEGGGSEGVGGGRVQGGEGEGIHMRGTHGGRGESEGIYVRGGGGGGGGGGRWESEGIH
eukprot:766980-Hanusia_phi.AAC.9